MIESFNKYKSFTLIALACLILIPIIFALLPRQGVGPGTIGPKPTLKPGKTLGPQIISPLQRTEIGKTTDEEVDRIQGVLSKEVLPGGQNKYNIVSPIFGRPNEIITQNGKAVFERELTPVDPAAVGYTTIYEILRKYGQPEKLIDGSRFYGWQLKQYIYSSKGFSFIGNPNNNEVYELSFFEPISVDEYIKKYGQDITSNASPQIEEH